MYTIIRKKGAKDMDYAVNDSKGDNAVEIIAG